MIELQRQFLSDKHASKCECENNNYPIRNGKVQSAQFHFWGAAAVNYYWSCNQIEPSNKFIRIWSVLFGAHDICIWGQ